MNALIFGANGQDGYFLNEICKNKGIEPIGISRSGNWHRGDVAEYEQVEHFIKKYTPVFIFHVAANSTTRHDALFENHRTISTGTLNILEAVYRHSKQSKVFITGSGVQFKNTGTPISEHDEFELSSAYSLSRIHSVETARYYRSLGLRTYVGYLFHHESPLRKSNHVAKMIALAVQRIACGDNEVIKLGNLSVEKEWTFAGDIAEGVFTLINQDDVFESTIGSGIAYSIENWLEQCFEIIGKDWRDFVTINEKFVPEYNRLVSNPSTIFSLGWKPRIDIQGLAQMMVNPS